MRTTFVREWGGRAALSVFAAACLVGLLAGTAWAASAPSHSNAEKQLRCLALNIYWEARSEPVDGQLAVAHVTLNRVADDAYPSTICGVVKEGALNGSRHGCQFSWFCDGKSDKPTDDKAWHLAQALAWKALLETGNDWPAGDALYYHATYVNPDWAKHMHEVARIGRHIYYAQADLKGG